MQIVILGGVIVRIVRTNSACWGRRMRIVRAYSARLWRRERMARTSTGIGLWRKNKKTQKNYSEICVAGNSSFIVGQIVLVGTSWVNSACKACSFKALCAIAHINCHGKRRMRIVLTYSACSGRSVKRCSFGASCVCSHSSSLKPRRIRTCRAQ